MKDIIFLYGEDGRLAYSGYATYAVKRLREDRIKVANEKALVERIRMFGYFSGYAARVVPASDAEG